MNNKNIFISLALIFAIVVALAYSNHFHNSFHFDDSHSIESNMSIRSIDVAKFFSDASTFGNLPANQSYRPLLTTILAIEHSLGAGNPLWFHIGAFSFYMLLWVLIYFLFRRIFTLAYPENNINIIALVGASFYILHTANAETVNYLSAQSDLISTTFMVSSLVLYALRPQWRRFGFYLLPAALAVFTKEVSAVFGFFMLAYIFYENAFSKDAKKRTTGQCVWQALPAILTCFFLLAFSSSMVPKTYTPSNVERWTYMLAQPFVIVHYVASFLLPFNLSADTDWQPISVVFDTRVVIGIAFIAFMIFIATWLWRKNETRPISFGIWWFFIGVLPPSSGVVVLSEVMNDHRMFLPFIGLAIAAAWGAFLFIQLKLRRTYGAMSLGMILIAVILSGHAYGTFQRNKVWKDEEHLWHDVTLKSPKNGRGLMNYGLCLMAKGQVKEALAYFDRARQYSPNYAYLHINTAIALDALGEKAKAEEYFTKAIASSPTYFGGYYYYSRFLEKQNRLEEAIPLLAKSLKLSAAFAESRYLLMKIYEKKQDWAALRNLVEDTLKLWPDNSIAQSFKKTAFHAINNTAEN